MKTLDEIIARDDYRRMNSVLTEKVAELAKRLRHKMDDLELEELAGYTIATVRSAQQGMSSDYLAVNDGERDYSLESSRSYYYCGDFHARVEAATGAMRLEFLNNYKKIIELIDEIETEKCANIQKAMEQL